jgi:hypothetical protein
MPDVAGLMLWELFTDSGIALASYLAERFAVRYERGFGRVLVTTPRYSIAVLCSVSKPLTRGSRQRRVLWHTAWVASSSKQRGSTVLP